MRPLGFKRWASRADDLLPDAKITENDVEDFIDVDPAGEPAQGPGSESQVLGRKFRQRGSFRPIETIAALLQRDSVARPAERRAGSRVAFLAHARFKGPEKFRDAKSSLHRDKVQSIAFIEAFRVTDQIGFIHDRERLGITQSVRRRVKQRKLRAVEQRDFEIGLTRPFARTPDALTAPCSSRAA